MAAVQHRYAVRNQTKITKAKFYPEPNVLNTQGWYFFKQNPHTIQHIFLWKHEHENMLNTASDFRAHKRASVHSALQRNRRTGSVWVIYPDVRGWHL